MAYLLSADVGTSSLKAVLLDEALRPVAQARVEYPTRHPAPGRAEQDPRDWYDAFCRAARELLVGARVPPREVAAVGVDGMSSTALAVDDRGRALRPALIWLDRRATAEARRLEEALGGALVSRCGNRADPSAVAPKLMWLRAHEPDVYRGAAAFLSCNGYVVQRLTGRCALDVSQAGLTLLNDVQTGDYDPALVDAAGLDRAKLPAVARCAEVVGAVTGPAAADSGLRPGTPVVAGAMDNVAAVLGMQVWREGDAYVAAGTVVNVGVVCAAPPTDGRGLVYHHALGDRWLQNGGVDAGGVGLRWFRDLLAGDDLDALCALVEPDRRAERALLFLPYMAGQRAPLWNDHATGVVLGLTPDTERRHLVRMFMESIALGARHVFEALRGEVPPRVTLTGGVTHSPAWIQVFADGMGHPLHVGAEPELGAVGTAILAGLGAGVFKDPGDAFARLAPPAPHAPRARDRAYYEALYRIHRSSYAHLGEDLAALDALQATLSAAQTETF